MKLRKAAAAVAVAVALGGLAGQARADAFAAGAIDITNFFFTVADPTTPGPDPMPISFVTQLSFTDTLSNTAQLTGFPTANTEGQTSTLGQDVNPPMACVGPDCAVVPQDFIAPFDPPGLTGPDFTFARADNLLTGVPFAGIPTPDPTDPPTTTIPPGVRAGTVAETTLDTPGLVGSSDSTIQLTSSFQFAGAPSEIPIAPGTVDIHFDADTFLQAWTAAGTTPGTQAGAGIEWRLTLSQGGVAIVDWAPGAGIVFVPGPNLALGAITNESCDLNQNTSVGPNEPTAAPALDCSGGFDAIVTAPLFRGVTYSLTITQNVSSQATQQEVPEPSALLLLGIGLAGLGFVRRYLTVC